MIKHLSSEGKEIPSLASSILFVDHNNYCDVTMCDSDILKLHKELSKKIAPARPKTVWLLYKESQKANVLNFLGPVKLIQRLMIVAILSLVLFIFISSSEYINVNNIAKGIYQLNGCPLLVVLMFYSVSASLGAAFSNLFQANRYIIRNTFDPKYEVSYWIRFVLGIIAGIMLAVIIPIPENGSGQSLQISIASRPMLAMLGGFSAALVYRIVYRMVFAVESIFIGKLDEQSDVKIAGVRSTHDIEKENEKQRFINQLLSLQGQVVAGKTPEDVQEEIKKTINTIIG